MQRFVLAAVVVAAANAGDAPRPDGAAPRRLRTPSGLVAPLRLASQKAREAHAAVVRDGDAEEGDADRACEDRLETLRGLVAEKRFDEAIDLSWALDAQSPKRRNACNADAPYAGKADVLRRMFRPLKAGNATSLAERRPSATSASKAKSCDDVRIKLHGNGTTHRLRGVSARSSQLGANVVGFVLDNEFVASRATMRCDETSNGFTCTSGDGPFSFQSLEALQRRDSEVRAKPKRAKRLDDVSTDYGLGSKKLLVLITCPTAHHADCDAGYDVVKGRSTGFDLDDFGGSVKTYLQAQYEQVNAFFLKSSYGQLQYVPTLTIAKIDYDMADCGTLKYLDVYGDRLGSSVDVMAFNYARVKNGFKVQDFDFWQIILPKCDALDWSGQAYVGLEESAINLGGQDAATIAHELGHNLGLSHASYDATTKGAVAWHDMEVDDWRDYASPFSVMGEADFEVAEAGEAYSVGQFSVEGKLNFDWLTNEDVALLEPYDANDVAQCSPCGPFLLQASDTGVFQAGELIGIEIGSKLAYRKLYAEYRSQWGGVLLTWADQGGEYWAAPDYGGTGVLANTVLVDTTPSTTSLKDAVLTPGESFLLDLGASADEAGLRFCTVDVGNVDANGRISVTVIASGTSAPTSTLSPTTASPTRRPTLASEQCSSTDKCCSKSEITVPSNDYFSAPRTFRKLEVGSAGSCCPSGGKKFCSFQNVDEGDFYYQYLFIYSASYFISSTLEECYADQNLYAQLDKAPLQAQCAAPTPEPTQRPTRNPVMAPGPTASYKPSAKPVSNPTPKPSVRPTLRPSFKPTALWSRAPTLAGATAAPSPECAGGLFRYKLELYPTAASFKAVYMLWYGEPVEGIVSVLRNMSLAAADVHYHCLVDGNHRLEWVTKRESESFEEGVSMALFGETGASLRRAPLVDLLEMQFFDFRTEDGVFVAPSTSAPTIKPTLVQPPKPPTNEPTPEPTADSAMDGAPQMRAKATLLCVVAAVVWAC